MFKEKIANIISNETSLSEEQASALIEAPQNTDFGDYAFPCFAVSNQLKKSPADISKELAGKIKADFIEKIESKGPYLNFFIKPSVLSKYVLNEIFKKKADYGKQKPTSFKVMVEYSQPNTHKEFHIGHLRTLFLGESIAKILEFSGKKVIRANYIGDSGAHIAKCLWCFLKFHKNDKIPENKARFLGEIYSEANRILKEGGLYKEEISEIQQKLENKEKQMMLIWIQTREWSLSEFMDIYNEMKVHFDVIYFESEVEKIGKEIVEDLEKKGIAKKDEQAILIDLEKYKLGKFLLLKSDGTTLYSTKDIALAKKKFKDYKLDESIYVVDSRQKLYFQQLFKTMELMGFSKKMVHVPYEFVALKEGIISSRTGVTALYDDLRSKMLEKAEREIILRHKEWENQKVLEKAKKIVESALKFSYLKIDNNKVIVFDIGEALDFEGETGPYIQYTHARLNSIIHKYGKKPSSKIEFSLLSENEEKGILNKLNSFESVARDAAEQYKPSIIARFLIELCQLVNEYYHKHNILKAEEETRKARVLLVECTKQVISQGLSLLNITALDEM